MTEQTVAARREERALRIKIQTLCDSPNFEKSALARLSWVHRQSLQPVSGSTHAAQRHSKVCSLLKRFLLVETPISQSEEPQDLLERREDFGLPSSGADADN